MIPQEKPSKPNSQIVQAFTLIKQQMELEEDKKRLAPLREDPENFIKASDKHIKIEEHKIELEKLFRKLKVHPEDGLSQEKASKRLLKNRANVLSDKTESRFILLLKELPPSPPAWILSLLVYFNFNEDPSNLYVGLAVFIINFLIPVFQLSHNIKCERTSEMFKNCAPLKTKVLRDGIYTMIDTSQLVTGDIIELEEGDCVPADIRIISSQDMTVDNSFLTGKSELLSRTVECTNKENPFETNNLAFRGTLIKEGTGKGIVIQTGDKTVIGQLAEIVLSSEKKLPPLRHEISRFLFIFDISVIIFGLFIFLGKGIFVHSFFYFEFSVALSFAFSLGTAILGPPVGFWTAITTVLTISARRLSEKKVLVKNLEAVENLGLVSCICADKTGTLTQNKMVVEHLWYGGKTVTNECDRQDLDFKNLSVNAILTSEAAFDKIDDSEAALIKFFQLIQDISVTRNSFPIKQMRDKSDAKILFNPSQRYSLVICEEKTENSFNTVFIKGAPEKIWSLCSHTSVNGTPQPIDDEWEKKFTKANLEFCQNGESVLAFAKLHLPKDKFPEDFQFNCENLNFPMTGFTFSGLVSLTDSIRETVPFSVLKCKTTGIKFIMVTGDHPVTAASIARRVNIFDKNEKTVNEIAEEKGISLDEAFDQADAIVIHGDSITQAAKEDEILPEKKRGKTFARWLTKSNIIFARTTSAQKLFLIKAFQQQGHTVAVTGNDLHDCPAVKAADIGITMDTTGSDITKDTANLILLTDDFSAIVHGIEEGRRVIDNLKKSITYCLASKIPEFLPFVFSFMLGLPLPLSPILILATDLSTNILPTVSFAYEDAELGIMKRPPQRKTEFLRKRKLLTSAYGLGGISQSLAGFLTYFIIMRDFGFPPGELIGMSTKHGFKPNEGDIFDPNAPFFGNTNKYFVEYCENCWHGRGDCEIKRFSDDTEILDWLYNTEKTVDLRLWFLRCNWENSRKRVNYGECFVKQVSPISKLPVCYTVEALKYAQTGFFISIVIAQIANALICQSRNRSLIFRRFNNFYLLFGICIGVALCLILKFTESMNVAVNTRDVSFLHFGVPVIPFCVLSVLFYPSRW